MLISQALSFELKSTLNCCRKQNGTLYILAFLAPLWKWVRWNLSGESKSFAINDIYIFKKHDMKHFYIVFILFKVIRVFLRLPFLFGARIVASAFLLACILDLWTDPSCADLWSTEDVCFHMFTVVGFPCPSANNHKMISN